MTNSNDRNTNRNTRGQEDQMGAKDELNTEHQPTGSTTEGKDDDTSSSAIDES